MDDYETAIDDYETAIDDYGFDGGGLRAASC